MEFQPEWRAVIEGQQIQLKRQQEVIEQADKDNRRMGLISALLAGVLVGVVGMAVGRGGK